MEYQKSTMKIIENLVYNWDKDKSIEDLIRGARTGRNLSFKSIKWLESNGIISIKEHGNQKAIRVNMDNYILQQKYYLDFIRFKTMNPFIKLVVKIFVTEIFNNEKVKSAALFGSVLKDKDYDDIDILLLGDNLEDKDIKFFSKIREKIERIFGVILNIHIGRLNLENLFKGIVVYQCSYLRFENAVEKQYLEFLEWSLESIKNKNEKNTFDVSFNNAILNLSFVYCHINSFNPKSKSESLEFFKKNNKVTNLEDLKKKGVEIGKRVFS